MDSIVQYLYLGIGLVVVTYAIVIYNALVNLKHAVTKAWSNIDILLKQRHDELPKLVETCRQHMGFEQEVLQRVIQARSAAARAREAADVAGVGKAESLMRAGLGRLFAVAEAYPDLKANLGFQQLQGRISALEDQIADRREFYNESVNLNNVRIAQVPDILIARLFGFRAATLLQFNTAELRDVTIATQFSG